MNRRLVVNLIRGKKKSIWKNIHIYFYFNIKMKRNRTKQIVCAINNASVVYISSNSGSLYHNNEIDRDNKLTQIGYYNADVMIQCVGCRECSIRVQSTTVHPGHR